MNIKKYVLSILVVVFIFLFDCNMTVYAVKNYEYGSSAGMGTNYSGGFEYNDILLECYYSNGIVVSYNGLQDTLPKIKDYPLAKTALVKNNANFVNQGFYMGGHAKLLMRQLVCPSWISYFMQEEHVPTVSTGIPNKESTDDVEYHPEFKSYYNFANCTNYLRTCGGQLNPMWIEKQLNKKDEAFWLWFWEDDEVISKPIKPVCEGSDYYAPDDGKRVEFNLVGERVYFVDGFGKDGYGPLYKKVDSNTQAVGDSYYAQFYKGIRPSYWNNLDPNNIDHPDKPDHGFLQVGDTMTGFKWVTMGEVMKNKTHSELFYALFRGEFDTICIKESKAPIENSEVTFYSVRHEVAVTNLETGCNVGWDRYELVEGSTIPACIINANSFCDDYPETAKVLRDIIKIVQLVIPALIIVLTGLEFGKMVLSGNIDEEIPKRKKSIIIRFIVAVTLFFLPTIVGLITKMMLGSGNNKDIGDISCLFGFGEPNGPCINQQDKN